MLEFARVDAISPEINDAGAPVDMVRLSWAGKNYYWETQQGKYRVGQQVAIKAPEYGVGSITPDLSSMHYSF